MRRAALGALMTLVAITPAAAHAADAPPPLANPVGSPTNVATCAAILLSFNPITGLPIFGQGPNAALKSASRVDDPDGSATLTVTVTGDLPATSSAYSTYDCLWVESGTPDGSLGAGEQLRPYYHPEIVVGGTSPNRTITFTVVVPHAAGRTICDRAAGLNLQTVVSAGNPASAVESGHWSYFVSNVLCLAPVPPANVPELPFVPLAGAVTAVVLGIGLGRRRLVHS